MSDGASLHMLSLLKKMRQRAAEEARELLWENIEGSLYWFGEPVTSESEASKAKLNIQFRHYHPTLVSLHTSFSGTVANLETDDVQSILMYGAARRISSIYRSANSICSIVYPDRDDVLTQDEAGQLSDALMIVYVHMVGVFDAIAIALKRLAGDEINIAEKNADILSAKFRKSVKFVSLEKQFKKNDLWFRRIKESLRNRYVHRVPPYVAPAQWTPEDLIENNRLQLILDNALQERNLEKIEEVEILQSKLGKFAPFINFVDSNEQMHLLPTLLDDLFRFQVLALLFLEELVPRLSFKS